MATGQPVPDEPPSSPPTKTEMLWECHRHARALCQMGWQLNRIIGANPNWENVAEIMAPIANAIHWLLDNGAVGWKALAMYDGLRPDAVFPAKCLEWPVEWGTGGYRSWHAAMFEQMVYDGSYFQLPVWVGTAQIGDWQLAPLLDWNNQENDSKSRDSAWTRIRGMSPPVTTSDGKVHLRMMPDDPDWVTARDWSDKDPVGNNCNFAGWWHLRNLDPYSQVSHLEAEYAYAVRHLDQQDLVERWSPYLKVDEWIEPLGAENRNGASRQLKIWAGEGKAERPKKQGDQQPRGWRVLLDELTPEQRIRVQDKERERIQRVIDKKK